MKNIFFTLIIAASAALFAIPSHLSAQPAVELNDSSTRNIKEKAEAPRGPVWASFRTQATSYVAPTEAIRFNSIGVQTQGIYPHFDYESNQYGILIQHSGAYKVYFSASNNPDASSNAVAEASVQLVVGGMPHACVDLSSTTKTPTFGNILQGTEVIIDICVPRHDCHCVKGVLLQLIAPQGLNLSTGTTGGETASLTIVRLGDAGCYCNE